MNNPVNFYADSLINNFQTQPFTVKGTANRNADYWRRILFNKLFSVFEFELPKEWKLNFFRALLFEWGSIAVIYTDKYGWICQPYSVTKLDLYYNPKVIEVYNQFITPPKKGVIGINAEIIHLFDDFRGMYDIVNNYATQFAEIDRNIKVSLLNSMVAWLISCKDKKQAEEMKKLYSDISKGNPAVYYNKERLDDVSFQLLLGNVKNTYIVNDLLTSKRTLMNEYLTTIGIRNANYEKKERLNSQEVNENNDESKSIVSVIYDNLKDCFERVNNISGLDLKVRLRYDYKRGDENVDNVNGNV